MRISMSIFAKDFVFSVSSSLIVAASSVAVSALSASITAGATSSVSFKAPFLFILFVAEVVFSIYFFYLGFFDNFEASVPAYVQPHVASEQVYVAVFDVKGVAFFDFFELAS